MTETITPAAPAVPAFGCAVTAATFSDYTTDRDRDDWTPGKMLHLVKALGDTPVAIVLDTFTGHAQVGVQLGGVRQTPGYGTFQVLVTHATYGACWHPLHKVGTVIVLGTGDVRGRALRTYRDERSAAIRKAIPLAVAKHPDVDDLLTGARWEVSRLPGHVTVSFNPDRERHPFRSGVHFEYWDFRPDQLG